MLLQQSVSQFKGFMSFLDGDIYFRRYHKMADMFVDKNRDLSPLVLSNAMNLSGRYHEPAYILRTYIHNYTHIHTYVHTYINTHMRTLIIQTYIYMHTYIYTHTYTLSYLLISYTHRCTFQLPCNVKHLFRGLVLGQS